MAEIAFETMRAALETTRGTAIAAPTHLLNVEGTITPKVTVYHPTEQRGTRAKNYRSVITRKWAEVAGKGDLDINEILFWLNMGVASVTTPSTPGTAVLSRLWAFVNNITADDIKSATAFWGDPALNQLQAPFFVLDEIKISNKATDDKVATIDVKGMSKFPTKIAAPAATASVAGAVLPGQLMQLWIDVGSTIGTTAITGRVLNAEHTIKTGAKQKYVATGPTSDLGFSLLGREKISAIETKLEFELLDFSQYDQWAAADVLKVRVRHNGSLIETISATPFYNYFEVDQYGPFEDLDWGDNEGTNRTVKFTINTGYDVTLGSDARVAVQNARTTL